jgi:hypothetical protein
VSQLSAARKTQAPFALQSCHYKFDFWAPHTKLAQQKAGAIVTTPALLTIEVRSA